jgi:hypothetical protein
LRELLHMTPPFILNNANKGNTSHTSSNNLSTLLQITISNGIYLQHYYNDTHTPNKRRGFEFKLLD